MNDYFSSNFSNPILFLVIVQFILASILLALKVSETTVNHIVFFRKDRIRVIAYLLGFFIFLLFTIQQTMIISALNYLARAKS
jgi:di/tricarboxylate transporter